MDNIRKHDEGIEAFMGKCVHEALEHLYNMVLNGKIPLFDNIVDQYNLIWDKKWHARIAIANRAFDSNYYRLLGEKCIAGYYRKYSPFNQKIVANELKIEFYLEDNNNFKILSVIDRLDHDGYGNWEIHDYKSGKRAYTPVQVKKDEQLALYQLALQSKEKNIKNVKLIWHFLQHGIELRSSRTEIELQKLSKKLMAEIKKITNGIKGNLEFAPKKSILCNWCYYWEECPAQNRINPYIK